MTRLLIYAALFVIPGLASAQSAYLNPDNKEDQLLDRIGIKFNTPYLRFSSIRPFSRKQVVADLEQVISDTTVQRARQKDALMLSEVDRANIQSFLMSNIEWSTYDPDFTSVRPVLKRFYKTKANAFEIRTPDLDFILNLVFQYQQFNEPGNNKVFLNSRGVSARAVIDKKVAFSFYLTENQEGTPLYVDRWVNKYDAVPGIGFYKIFKNNYDYFDMRSSVSWSAFRFLDMQLAYDTNFIGNGYRSLLLSDAANSYMFLKLNWHSGKWVYQNIFAELFPYHVITYDRPYPRKYFRAHYLNYSATSWLNIGLFEGTIMGQSRRMPGALFNPVIFLNLTGKNDVGNRSYVGADIKVNVFRRLQLYGQFVADRLNLEGLKEKSWDNRFGYQAGFKYIDVFGLKNVDIQVETNRVRPYTYAANDSITSYTHYNQPFVHPMGANFREYIGLIKLQPLKRVYLQGKLIRTMQGLDIGTQNYGSNPFRLYHTRAANTGVTIGSGDKAHGTIASILASYEWRENLFFETSFTRRSYRTEQTGINNTSFFSAGIRWNMARREYDF